MTAAYWSSSSGLLGGEGPGLDLSGVVEDHETQSTLDLYLLNFRWELPGTSPGAGRIILDDVILWTMGHFGSL